MSATAMSTAGLCKPAEHALPTNNAQDSRMQRPGVISRLHALFPASSASSAAQDSPHAGPHVMQPDDTASPNYGKKPRSPRKFLKIRVVTWNMHESLPKGDLEELLGAVPSANPSSPAEHPALTRLAADADHPYHLVVIAGQECPSVSGIPLALGAGFKLKEKDRKEKDKDKDKDEPDRPHSRSEKENEEHDRPHSRQRLHRELSSRRSREDDSGVVSLHDLASLHRTAYGWSSMLEDWYSNGSPSTSCAPAKSVPAQTPLLDVPGECEPIVHGNETPSKAKSTGDLSLQTNGSAGPKGPYELLIKERMMGLYLAVYINRDIKGLVRGTSKSAVTAGLIGGRVGNKGGVGISLNIDGTTLLFINAHLAAHEGKLHHRLANLTKIKTELAVDPFERPDDRRVMAEDITDRFDHTFFCGDLNFRLKITRLHADWLISRKEYEQALAFDQLHEVMRTGDAFRGFKEAPINFPPTFKYDVHKRHKHRSSKRYSKNPLTAQHYKLLSEIEENHKEHDEHDDRDEHEDEDDDDGDGEGENEGASVTSAYTSVNSRYTVDGDDHDDDHEADDEDFHPPTARANASTGKLVHKMWAAAAAHKAKAKWVSILSSSSLPGTPSGKQTKWKHRLGETSPLSSGVVTPDFKATTFPPTPVITIDPELDDNVDDSRSKPSQHLGSGQIRLSIAQMGRASSIKSYKAKANDEEGEEEKGVYDSSHKKRVPSWCDRILWKSTVVPDPESEEELEPEEPTTSVPPPRTRMGHIFQALRPSSLRTRKDSHASTSSAEGTPVGPTSANTLASSPDVSDGEENIDKDHRDRRISPFTRFQAQANRAPRRLSHSKSIDSLPSPDRPALPLPRSQTHTAPLEELDSRVRRASLVPLPSTRTLSSPTSPSVHRLAPAIPGYSITANGLLSPPDTPPPVPPKDPSHPSLPMPSRWRFGFLPFLSRDNTAQASSASEQLPTPAPPLPRKGDVVCLSYDTLDDKAMGRLDARSDHRPVIGSYAVYV